MKSTEANAINELHIRSHGDASRADWPRLRRVSRWLLQQQLKLASYALDVHLVDTSLITELNECFLRHAGSTDVIAFDHSGAEAGFHAPGDTPVVPRLRGEIFISVDDVCHQAMRFGVSSEEEAVRCLIHGVLHLAGYDDTEPAARRRMKREENRLVRLASQQFGLRRPARMPRVGA